MRKGRTHASRSHEEFTWDFDEIEKSLNRKFEEAIVAHHTVDQYEYFMTGRRKQAAHALGIFALAESMRSLRRRTAEVLEFAVPILRIDNDMPHSTLGETPDTHYFLLTYMARRGGEKIVRVDETVYEERFERSRKPIVPDLAEKIEAYTVIPLYQREPGQQDLTG